MCSTFKSMLAAGVLGSTVLTGGGCGFAGGGKTGDAPPLPAIYADAEREQADLHCFRTQADGCWPGADASPRR